MDYAYKGDDDTLIIPANLAYQIEKMKPESTAMGSLKPKEAVDRKIDSKYYVPEEIQAENRYDDYFSGAGYVMKGSFALAVAKVRHETPGKYEIYLNLHVYTSLTSLNISDVDTLWTWGRTSAPCRLLNILVKFFLQAI